MPEAGIPSGQGRVDKRAGSSPIRVVVGLLAAVAAVFLVAIGALARAAATGAESYFNFLAWLIPSMGVVLSLVLALVGTFIVRRMMKGQASSARPEATVEAAKETAAVVGQDAADLSEQGSGQPHATDAAPQGQDAGGAADASAHEEEAEGGYWLPEIDSLGRVYLTTRRPGSPPAPLSEVKLAFARALELPRNKVDVIQRDDDLVVRAELPGVRPDKVDITIQGNVLTILKKITKQGEEAYPAIKREDLLLPQHVDEDDVSRRFKDGVLEVTLKGATPRAPIPGYDELNVEEVSRRLEGLSVEELRLVRDYEERNKRRETLLERMDRKIRA